MIMMMFISTVLALASSFISRYRNSRRDFVMRQINHSLELLFRLKPDPSMEDLLGPIISHYCSLAGSSPEIAVRCVVFYSYM